MARLSRYTVPGQPQHVIQRGNNRSAIFKAEQDYQFYRDCLAVAATQYGCAIHAYVLMTNHVHLLLTPNQPDSIPKTLQSLGRRYVQYFNFHRRRTGTLWEGRYRATLIDSAGYLLTCSQYIELNPVRAKMVGHARSYPWSSYRWHAEGKTDPLITDHRVYRALGKTAGERQRAYRELCRVPLAQENLVAIREATNKGWVLGSTRYKKAMAARLPRRVAPLPKGRPRKETP